MSTSQQPSTTEPAKLGGYGKDYSGKHEETRAGLVGKVFPTNAPPDISPRTRILAVCGIPDRRDSASPTEDGWFFSDFFLFHHLFRGVSANQIWLACANPVDLVKKYKEYVHGDPRGERKVVLDQGMLPQVTDVRVVPPKELLDRFRSTLREQARLAVVQERPLLVMIFGHGEYGNKGILMGTDIADRDEKHHLQRTEVSMILGPTVQATILTSSCYGGGWAMFQELNTTTMAAATAEDESLSWPASASIKRCCGGRFATAITKLIIRYSITDSIPLHNVPNPRDNSKPESSEQTILSSRTYAGLLQTVRGILDHIDQRPENGITFSAQNDTWTANWSPRTGIPLADFELKWNQLRSIPVGDYDAPGSAIQSSRTGSIRLGRRLFTSHQASRSLRVMAQTYWDSYPGNPSAAKNHSAAGACVDLLNGRTPSKPLEEVYAILDYRLNKVMALATSIKNYLGVDFPDCQNVDVVEHRYSLPDHRRNILESITDLVVKFKFFEQPEENEGWVYYKGDFYLGLVVESAGWNQFQAWEKLKEVDTSKLTGTYEIMKELELHRHQSIRQALQSLGKETGKRLRSMSPKKHARKRLPSQFGASASSGPGFGGPGFGGPGFGGSGSGGSGSGGLGAGGPGAGASGSGGSSHRWVF